MRMRSIAPGAARWPLRSARPRRPGRSARSRRAGAPVAEHDLGVGADVDEQGDLVRRCGALGQDHAAGAIGADVAGDAGQV
jgi:hypothetical protein